MTRVGWLVDHADHVGGAELTQAEFRDAAPDDVEIVDCRPQAIYADCDRYVVQNCVQYTTDDLVVLEGKPVTKFWHDVGPHLQAGVREWLDEHSTPVCCSPIQAEYMDLERGLCIPPPVDLGRFGAAASRSNGSRSGAVCVGSWRNFGKAPHKAHQYDPNVTFYGSGIAAPRGSQEVAYEDMPELLARYQTLVFLPTVIEPFSRVVVEGWAAGLEIVTNRLVGALYWIEEAPEKLNSAAEDFWAVVLNA